MVDLRGVSENRGPYYSTLNSRIRILRTPQIKVPPVFSETFIAADTSLRAHLQQPGAFPDSQTEKGLGFKGLGFRA